MTTEVDMGMGTTTTTTMSTTLIPITRIPTTAILITHMSMNMVLLHITMIMPAIMCIIIQICIPSIPSITVRTIVLIAVTVTLLCHLPRRTHIHNPITIMNGQIPNLPIPTCIMRVRIPTTHILLHLRRKFNTIRSLPQSGDENLILEAHHFKLR